MGFIKQCDICEAVFDSPSVESDRLLIQFGQNLIYEGYLCVDCYSEFIELFTKFINSHESHSGEVSASSQGRVKSDANKSQDGNKMKGDE